MFAIDGLLDLNDLWEIVKTPGFPELRDPPWTPVTQPRLQANESEQPDVMAAMREGDILVHHPYDSFSTSVERLVEEAVADPDVLAIKQTVYRTSDDSPLVPALIRAAERGKQAVCLVELKARFDERANITWARALEEAGVHVVYGLPSLKTHAKCILIIRREGDGVRNYVHVGTGNYHPNTARLYTDFGLLTCDERIGADVADMFNFLTGFGRPRRYRQVLIAPAHLRDGILAEIERTIEAHREGRHARIAMKMNSLVDRRCIRALYEASQAGVPVDLNIRGICCLRPGVPGVSENIRVVSIVGRFLEHSRIYAFERGDTRTVYIGSADLMPRNLDTRVELLAPVRDDALRADLLDTLERCFADNTNAWELGQDGTWTRRRARGPRAPQRPARADDGPRRARARGRRRRRLAMYVPELRGVHPGRLGGWRFSRPPVQGGHRMKLHANAALSLNKRRVLCRRVVDEQWTLTRAAEAAEVSVRCARKWVGRYRCEGELGLLDRSSAPGRVANRTDERRVEAIAALRRLRFTAPEIAEVLRMPLSTVSGILTRIGMGRLGRLGLEPAERYERASARGAGSHRRQEARADRGPGPPRDRQPPPGPAPHDLHP